MPGGHKMVAGTERKEDGAKIATCAADQSSDNCWYFKSGFGSWKHVTGDPNAPQSTAPRRLF